MNCLNIAKAATRKMTAKVQTRTYKFLDPGWHDAGSEEWDEQGELSWPIVFLEHTSQQWRHQWPHIQWTTQSLTELYHSQRRFLTYSFLWMKKKTLTEKWAQSSQHHENKQSENSGNKNSKMHSQGPWKYFSPLQMLMSNHLILRCHCQKLPWKQLCLLHQNEGYEDHTVNYQPGLVLAASQSQSMQWYIIINFIPDQVMSQQHISNWKKS